MKKLILVGAVAGLFAMVSCKKCVTCNNCNSSLTSGTELCEEDFSSEQAYNDGVAILEAAGCTCN